MSRDISQKRGVKNEYPVLGIPPLCSLILQLKMTAKELLVNCRLLRTLQAAYSFLLSYAIETR